LVVVKSPPPAQTGGNLLPLPFVDAPGVFRLDPRKRVRQGCGVRVGVSVLKETVTPGILYVLSGLMRSS